MVNVMLFMGKKNNNIINKLRDENYKEEIKKDYYRSTRFNSLKDYKK